MATIIDVARRANVAISTVSNILNGTKYVSDEVTEKVMRAVQELNYEIDPIARNMKGTHSRNIGVIVTNGSRIFFSPILRSILETAAGMGYNIMTFDSNDDLDWEKKYVSMMCQNRFDGIILDSVAESDDTEYFTWLSCLSYRKKRIQVVSMERDLSAYGIASVVPDNYGGACKVVQHLADCGCKRLLHIAGPVNSPIAEERARGFFEESDRCAATTMDVEFGDFSPQSGYKIVEQCIQKNTLHSYDAIFASNDQMAVGAIKALLKARVHIPDDIRIVGFDDTFVASLIDPPLTTVRIAGQQLGREAMCMLAKRIDSPEISPPCNWLDTELIIRVSTDRRAGNEWEFQCW